MKKERIYIAGPMTGIARFNYPAFNSAADKLRELGYEVENPAENPKPECGTWEGYMRMSVVQIAGCDSIALLPGWLNSKGALLEVRLAADLGITISNIDGLLA